MRNGIHFIEEARQDLRYGGRMLLKNPGFTAIAVITLALGIGANSAIFSIVNALMLRPLPFNNSERLVQVWEVFSERGQNSVTASYPNFADWRDQNDVFEAIAGYADAELNLTGVAEPERIHGSVVSPAFFSMLGIQPIAGRVLLPEEDYPNKAFSAVISEPLWRRRFNADPQMIGQGISLNNQSFTVVGVIAPITDLTGMPNDTEVWIPISLGGGFNNRRGHYLNVMARLKPGVTHQQAQANMDVIASALAAEYPDANKLHGLRLVPLQEQIVGDLKLALLVLLGAVALVLLIASANVANMLLARATSRRKEIAIRIALGAARSRLLRQLLTESLLLSTLGSAAGLLLALWGVYLLSAFGPADLPRLKEVVVDGRVLGFTLVVSLLAGVVFGLVPALQASQPDLNETLKESGRSATSGAGPRRLRALLVVSEIVLSFVLLVGAGLLMRSFLKLQAVDPGFNPQNLLATQISLNGPNYETDESVIAFFNELIGQIKALPGVESVAIRSHIPIGPNEDYANQSFAIKGRPSDLANQPSAFYNAISPDYFHAMEIPVLQGRPFDEHDVKTAQKVVIINETLARLYFPDEDPIGQRLTKNVRNPKEDDWATIVGVVKDTKPRALDGDPVSEMYMPFAQQPRDSMAFMIRTTGNPESVAAAVRHAPRSLDKDQPFYGLRTFETVISEAVVKPRFRTFLLTVFAGVALILAMVGIYGVMSNSVEERLHEIGIRMALGASGADVLKLILGYGMALTLAGIGIGLVAGFALTRVMSQLLFGVKPTDPLTFTVIALSLITAALLACCIPAYRAMKVDPIIALRCE
ncbi:MAG TPA: ABC transporter permease [Blastocatellia bacterium]|nr:ABC transporter permease [Blastocatellia bacterium]